MKKYKKSLNLIVILYTISSILFLNFYFNEYSTKYASQPFFDDDLIGLITYLDKFNIAENKNIYIETTAVQPYIYMLVATKMSPYEFDRLKVVTDNVISCGKYHFLIPTEFDINCVYVVYDVNIQDKLINEGFSEIEYKNYKILYTTNDNVPILHSFL